MQIGIGLPASVTGVDRDHLLTWARTADEHGYSGVAVLDRLVHNNWDAVIALAAAAAVTERVTLTTAVLVAPYRGNAALLAKQLATVDRLSRGRLVIGLAAGTRSDDYVVSHVDFKSRGHQMDMVLDTFAQAWASHDDANANDLAGIAAVGPPPWRSRPPLLIGGTSPAALRRAATRGDGWIMGGGNADAFRSGRARLAEAWSVADRTGQPRTAAIAYFALGPDGEKSARDYLGDYYAFLGENTARDIAESAVVNEAGARERVRAFADAGCDELFFMPCDASPRQINLLTNALGCT